MKTTLKEARKRAEAESDKKEKELYSKYTIDFIALMQKEYERGFQAGYDKALKDHNILTAEQAKELLDYLESPPCPNEKLMEAAKQYKEAIENGELVIKD